MQNVTWLEMLLRVEHRVRPVLIVCGTDPHSRRPTRRRRARFIRPTTLPERAAARCESSASSTLSVSWRFAGRSRSCRRAELTVINVQSPSVTWVGTRQGAIRLSRDNQVARVLRRPALAALTITSPASASTASVTWIETPKGFARIEDVPMTLDDKSRVFVDRIQAGTTGGA